MECQKAIDRAGNDGIFKRSFQRYSVTLPCLVRPFGGGKPATEALMLSQTVDVSRGGFLFVSKEPWKVGNKMECLLRLPFEALPNRLVGIRGRGKVVRVASLDQGGYVVGATIEHFSFFHVELKDDQDRGQRDGKSNRATGRSRRAGSRRVDSHQEGTLPHGGTDLGEFNIFDISPRFAVRMAASAGKKDLHILPNSELFEARQFAAPAS